MPDERRPCQRAVAKVDLTHEAPIARRSARGARHPGGGKDRLPS